MKKIALLFFLLFTLVLTACNRNYTYEEVTSFSISSIESIETNGGHLQSFRANVSPEKAELLNLEYKITNKDVAALTYNCNHSNQDYPSWYGGLIYIRYSASDFETQFVIGEDGYIYSYNPILKKSFMSTEKIDISFFAKTGMFE